MKEAAAGTRREGYGEVKGERREGYV